MIHTVYSVCLSSQYGTVNTYAMLGGLDLKHSELTTVNGICRESGRFYPALRFIFTLEGQTHLRFGSREIRLKADSSRSAACLPINMPEEGCKIFHNGRQRELVLLCSSVWLENMGCPPHILKALRQAHLQPYYLSTTPPLAGKIRSLMQTCRGPAPWRALHQTIQSMALAAEVLQILFPGHAPKPLSSRLQKLLKLLHDPAAANACLNTLAKACHSNTTTLQQEFQTAFGISIAHYRREYRLQLARNALLQNHSVGEAAVLAGYGNPECFSKAFKKLFGRPPSRYRPQQEM